MLLDLPTKSLEVSLGALPTVALALVCEYTAGLPTGQAPQAQKQVCLLIGAAGASTIVPAPSSGQQYEVTHFSLFNANPVALVAAVQLRVTPADGTPSTVYVKYQATLQPGDNLFYQSDNHGFFVIDATGAMRGTVPLPLGAATEATLALLALVQGTATSGARGPLVQGAVEALSPHLLADAVSPVSLDQDRRLRVVMVAPNLEGTLQQLLDEVHLLRVEQALASGVSLT